MRLGRLLCVAAVLTGAAVALEAQTVGTLHIKVVLTDADGKPVPVARHALLISDNPSTAAPRRVVTGVDGTIDVRLRPGNYTVESDEPVTFRGTAFQWTQTLDIRSGREATLELTTANAETHVASAASTTGPPALEAEPSLLLPRWQDSVAAIWTPTARASGFLIDAKGLVATNQRAVGSAAAVEVQFSSSLKVEARVLVSDSARDIAVLWIDPGAAGSTKAVPLGCATPKIAGDKEEVFAIGVPLRHDKDVTSGTTSDLFMLRGTDGGPVFTADGRLIGMTAPGDRNARVIRAADICGVLDEAQKKMATASPPAGTHLPVEPGWPIPVDAFKHAAEHRVGSLNPYQLTTNTFDVAFITPVMTYGTQYQSEQMSRRRTNKDGRTIEIDPILVRPVMDFDNWFEYLDDFPSVLLVRVTPKQAEGLWKKVARGAAFTQGVALPPTVHAKSGFARLRAYCGDMEVVPIHPLTVEHRLSDTEAAYEGLYVFEPGAFAPKCSSVRLVLYGEKNPDRPETAVVDPRILQQITQDFALYPEAGRP